MPVTVYILETYTKFCIPGDARRDAPPALRVQEGSADSAAHTPQDRAAARAGLKSALRRRRASRPSRGATARRLALDPSTTRIAAACSEHGIQIAVSSRSNRLDCPVIDEQS